MRIFAFTGMPGAGKSEAVKVAEEMGLPVYRMGETVWDEVRKRGLPIDDKNVGAIASEMREKYGKEVWAKRTLEKIDSSLEKVVIDGIRSIEEVDFFREKLGKDFLLIAIHASPKTRYERLLKRKRRDDGLKEEDFKKRDERELSWGIGAVIALADIVVINEGTLEEFKSRIRELLKSL